MLVVSDASPLNILIRTGFVGLLPQLYHEVFIPTVVAAELSHPRTPLVVRGWLEQPPHWLHVRKPSSVDMRLGPDPGEREAIALALELHAPLLADDLKARRIAKRLGVVVSGTLGVLELAASMKLINLREALDRVRQTDFFLADDLIDAALLRQSRQLS